MNTRILSLSLIITDRFAEAHEIFNLGIKNLELLAYFCAVNVLTNDSDSSLTATVI